MSQRPVTVWDRFAVVEQRDPAAIAIRGERDQSYRQLRVQAGALAAELARYAEAGQLVAMELARPSLAVPVILAAASRHCPVLPLNSESPPAHRDYVLADARPVVLVRGLVDGEYRVEPIEHRSPPGTPPADLRQAAYVIYTSGSTGRPKGVVVGHDALLDRLDAFTKVPGFGPSDSIVSMTAPSFDISLAELLLPLVVGASLVAAPVGASIDPAIFAELVSRARPSVIQATPSFWRLALAWGWTGAPQARLWCGGEALTAGLAERLVGCCAQLWNLYGPTEATIWASAALIGSGQPIGLGDPLPGARWCLAGEDGLPITEPLLAGELLLYGSGLAIGYLNRPELTGQRFADCLTPDGPQRCYRTGDLAQFRTDGSMQFLGRGDGQVKLRGHRIELTEIEAVAEELAGVQEAAAVLRETDDPARTHIA
ncbi:MAG: AMP-binding protein, partial [Jatrophihabitantaceae bacterium]